MNSHMYTGKRRIKRVVDKVSDRVKSGKFGHQVNSDTRLQTV